MQLTFLETPVFTRQVMALLEDAEYRRLQEHLLAFPEAGAVIPGTAGCRKLRWRRSHSTAGKRGGVRVIYYFDSGRLRIYMLLVYDHRVVDDLDAVQRRQLATLVRQLKSAPNE